MGEDAWWHTRLAASRPRSARASAERTERGRRPPRARARPVAGGAAQERRKPTRHRVYSGPAPAADGEHERRRRHAGCRARPGWGARGRLTSGGGPRACARDPRGAPLASHRPRPSRRVRAFSLVLAFSPLCASRLPPPASLLPRAVPVHSCPALNSNSIPELPGCGRGLGVSVRAMGPWSIRFAVARGRE